MGNCLKLKKKSGHPLFAQCELTVVFDQASYFLFSSNYFLFSNIIWLANRSHYKIMTLVLYRIVRIPYYIIYSALIHMGWIKNAHSINLAVPILPQYPHNWQPPVRQTTANATSILTVFQHHLNGQHNLFIYLCIYLLIYFLIIFLFTSLFTYLFHYLSKK
jgi:hypothetical protein